MSRINRARIVDGDQATAASLNDRFDDFTQPNEVNQFNLRDSAVDLPQIQKSPKFQAPFIQTDVLGKSDMLHAAPVSVGATGSTPYSFPHVIQDGAANPTIASYGSGGLSLTVGDVLRIYWSLSVRADLSSSPWDDGFQFNTIAGTGGGGNLDVSTSAGCFVAWLQWDVTSNSLTNWTEVPGQSDFKTALGSYHGSTLQLCQATTVIPLWSYWLRNLNNGDASAGTTAETKAMGWRGISGAWHYPAAGSVTVYGLRVVLLGVMHPQRVSAGAANTLVLDIGPAASVDLEYTGGRLVTLVNKVK